MARHKLMKGFTNVFVSREGYVFRQPKQQRPKEKIPLIFSDGEVPKFMLFGKEYNLLYVMMEAFDIRYTPSDNLKFKVTDKGYIPVDTIKVSKFIHVEELSTQESDILYSYRCDEKAKSANNRATEKITPLQVYFTLKLHDFRCRYCNQKLHHNTWQLDHYIPLSVTGKNVFTNIVPACKKCNIMKSTMMPQQFISLCKKVVAHAEMLNNNNGHDDPINPNKNGS